MSFIFLNPSRIRFMTMDCILLPKISEDMENIYRTFHTCPYHKKIGIIRKKTSLSMNNTNIIYQSCSSLFKEAYPLSILNTLLFIMQSWIVSSTLLIPHFPLQWWWLWQNLFGKPYCCFCSCKGWNFPLCCLNWSGLSSISWWLYSPFTLQNSHSYPWTEYLQY